MNQFRTQGGLTIITKIKPGQTKSLRDTLKLMVTPHADVEDNDIIPFAEITTVHFVRLLVIDKSLSVDGTRRTLKQPLLVLSSNYDEPEDAHLKEFVDVAGDGLDKIYEHCEGYPSERTPESRLAYLRGHRQPYAAFYDGSVGLSVIRIKMEARLHDEIESFIDKQGYNRNWQNDKALHIREEIRRAIAQTDLSWALQPAPGPSLGYKLFRGTGWKNVLWFFLSLPIVLLLLPLWLIILRYKETHDKQFQHTRYDARAVILMGREDKVVQNQMTNLVDMKPGLFRMLVSRWFFNVVELATRYIFTKGKLGGIPTIHFARWVRVDQNRGLLFFSNYGDSWESYLGDFIDKAAVGLTGAWSSAVLFPKTRFLVFDGATDEERFKAWARAQQMITDVWYTAYKNITVKNIINNKKIREGLSGDMKTEQALEWLRRL